MAMVQGTNGSGSVQGKSAIAHMSRFLPRVGGK